MDLIIGILGSIIAAIIVFWATKYFNHKWYFTSLSFLSKSELIYKYKNKEAVLKDLKQDIETSERVYIYAGRGNELRRDTFESLFSKRPHNRKVDLKILLPNPDQDDKRHNWLVRRESELSSIDEGFRKDMLTSEIVSSIKYLIEWETKNFLTLRLFSFPHIGRLIFTDNALYFTPYSSDEYARENPAYKFKKGDLYKNYERLFNCIWDISAQPKSEYKAVSVPHKINRKVALVNPPYSKLIYGEEISVKSITPCLGLHYLKAYNDEFADIRVFEGEAYDTFDEMVNDINEFAPDILGVTTNTSVFEYCIDLTRKITSATLKIAGGPYSSFRIDESLKYFDIVFIGDAEESFRQLLQHQALKNIPAIAYKENGVTIKTGGFGGVTNLDILPLLDYNTVYSFEYKASIHRKTDSVFASVMATRGCGFKCNFCLSAKGGLNDGKYRARGIKNVIEEISEYKKNGVNAIQFWDDTFTMQKTRTIALCNELKKLQVKFVCNTRVDKVDEEIIIALKGAGCQSVFFGIEAANDLTLDKFVDKGINVEQIKNAIELCKKHNINSTMSFILGNINDKEEDIQQMTQLAIACNPTYVLFNIYTAHPGTHIYAEALKEGIINEYTVDTNKYIGEPVGVPTICKEFDRAELQKLKYNCYISFYKTKGTEEYDNLVKTYEANLKALEAE